MRGKILFVAGAAAGYVLGAKAGRQRYNQIAAAASRLWNNPNVQKQVVKAEDFVKDHAPDVAELVADNAKKVAGAAKRTASTRKSGSTSSGAASSTTASAGIDSTE